MATRPDDIPDSELPKHALLAAAQVVIMLPAFERREQTSDAITRVARAILAAEQRERERCAQAIKELCRTIENRDAATEPQDEWWVPCSIERIIDDLGELAAAIREPQP